MSPTDPQFAYIVLALPTLFSLVLIGEGINQVVQGEIAGIISIIFGLSFLVIVVFAFFFFSSYLNQHI